MALDRGGIGKHFSHIFCHMDLGTKKDQPEFWDAVARTLGHSLDQVAMVGDSLQYDAIGPRSFGVQAYWLNRDGQPTEGQEFVPQVASLQQFAAAVAGFGLVLRDSPHRGTASLPTVVRWAELGAVFDPGGHRADFLALVRRAETLVR